MPKPLNKQKLNSYNFKSQKKGYSYCGFLTFNHKTKYLYRLSYIKITYFDIYTEPYTTGW